MSTNFLLMKKWSTALIPLLLLTGQALAQSANFNFTAAAASVSGWTNAAGDPSVAVRSVTAPSGITLTSVATVNWYPEPTGNTCAFNGGGVNQAGFFPAAVLVNHWFVYGTTNAATLNVSAPQLIIGGLHADSTYIIRLSGSFSGDLPSPFNLEPEMYTIIGATNYGSLGINGDFNVQDGAVFNGVIPDSTGKIRVYLNTGTGSNVASLCGLQVATGQPTAANLTLGAGLGQLGQAIALGDSVTGLGPHSFASNRYQYLNKYQYSFGGSVKDAVNHPVLRLYDNGDLAASTTMDKTVNTDAQTGLRFYSKLGILQIGATDHLDTTVFVSQVPETWPGGGILVNSNNNRNPNTIKGRLYDSYVQGNSYTIDSTVQMDMVILNGQNTTMSGGYVGDIFNGYGLHLGGNIDYSIVTGNANYVTKPTVADNITGFLNRTQDSSYYSLISGAYINYGGLYQFASGANLANRTPAGAVLGNANVDFTTLSYTGTKGLTAPGLAGYPLFAIGNSNASSNALQSNAMTVLYNGRTQINTTGFSTGLTQTAVTPQAALDVVSTNTGALLPRLTNAQRNAIISGDLHSGLLLYNTDSSSFQYYNGTGWVSLGTGSASARWSFSSGSVYDSVDNIAIGTSNTQGYKLAVNGSAIFTRAVVKPYANWPDYVFDENYALPGLDELSRYIRENHHLPGMAGEQEVMQKGIDVAEQQKGLLKNVEELTLYLIRENKSLSDQHNELVKQAGRLDTQQKEIDELKALIVSRTKQQKSTK